MYSFKDRLIDWVNNKGAWTHILLAVGITLLVTTIILAAAMPSKGVVNANAGDIGGLKTTIGTVVDALSTKASQTELDGFSENVTNALDDQARDVTGLRNRVNTAETKLNEARTDITNIQDSLADQVSLTGTFGNYTLHAKSNVAGNFTANVHLIYSAPIYVGNTTTHDETLSAFYSGISWTETTPLYATVATFNGMAWGISEVWWNIGTFELVGNTEKALNIKCTGLNSTWKPSFAYVEVWRVA
jgi:hypothetical protein